MTISSLKRGQIKLSHEFDSEEQKISLESRLIQWLGISDISESWMAYQKGDFPSALKAFGFGVLKLGTVAAAFYGAYRWAAGPVIHLNDYMTQAVQDFKSGKSSSSVPSSVANLIGSLYEEQSIYSRWPKTGIQFVNEHLTSGAPMSSAILKYLLEVAEKKGDSSLERELLKICKTANSSTEKGCLAAVEYLTDKTHPDALSNAVRIALQCRNNEKLYCNKVIENGKIQSIQEKSLSDVVSLIEIISTRAEVQKNRLFAETAIALFQPQLEQLQKEIKDCDQAYQDLQQLGKKDAGAADPASWAPCYAHANWFEQFIGLRDDQWKKHYASKKIDDLSNTLNSSLRTDGKTLAQFCALMSGSPLCQTFAEEICHKLLISNQFEEAQQLMLQAGETLKMKIELMLDQLEQQGKWDESVSFLLSYHKANPSIDLQRSAEGLWTKIMQSKEPHKAVSLLNLDINLDILKTLDQALKHHDNSHLHRVYLLAKSWIDKKDAKYDEPLKRIIRGFFAIRQSSAPFFLWEGDLDKEEMAKVLVTKWAYAKDPQRINAVSLKSSYRLNRMQGSQFDHYSDEINEQNWEQKIS